MKIVLIYAKSQTVATQAATEYSEARHADYVLTRDEIYPPLGITILAAWLEQRGHVVRLRDDSIDSLDDLRAQMEWAEAVGISALTANARRARELGKIARLDIGRPVILGGPHPTTNPEYFLESDAADVCVHGEGDVTLPQLLEVLDQPAKWQQVQGIAFLEAGEVVRTPPRPLFTEMDEVPLPAYHLWDMERYMALAHKPVVTLMSSRGCPYACTFCDAEMTPRQYRAMSPERTVDLMEHILETYRPQQLVFYDDLFTIQRKRVIAICKEILRRDLYLEWTCESRVDTMDYEMLRWLRKAGCVKIYYGLESGSPRMLLTMKKRVTPERVKAGAKLNRQLGMYFRFFILYGFPEETEEDHHYTEHLVAGTRPDAITVSLLQPIPGTEVYEQLKPHLLADVAEMDFHYWHGTEFFKHPHFSRAQLEAARERLIRTHASATTGLLPRLGRKLERLAALVSRPELVKDLLEIRRRRRRYRRSRMRAAGAGLRPPAEEAVTAAAP